MIQAAVSAGLILVSGYLIYRYIQYGESETAAHIEEERADSMCGEDTGETGKSRDPAAGGDGAEAEGAAEEYNAGNSTGRDILVRILTTGYEKRCHDSVTLTCDSAYTVYQWEEGQAGDEEDREAQQLEAGEEFCVRASSLAKDTLLCVDAENGNPVTVTSIVRGDGAPGYSGKLYLKKEEDGIALYNELPLEEYLCSVVSSEMPPDYPAEALKAQAVCARTYARSCMQREKTDDISEDLDDSVAFQVYNNYRSSEASRNAVEATAGQTLPLDEVQYYSTACLSKGRDDLGSDEAFAQFLSAEPPEDAEYGSPWLRWEVRLSQEQLLASMREQYGYEAETVSSVSVLKRAQDGQVLQLAICGEEQAFMVDGAYAVRCVLSPGQAEIVLRDSSSVSGMRMLPSAYFTIQAIYGTASGDVMSESDASGLPDFIIRGGGYGHGIGMSQCGAAQMASEGACYTEILEYYYGCDEGNPLHTGRK